MLMGKSPIVTPAHPQNYCLFIILKSWEWDGTAILGSNPYTSKILFPLLWDETNGIYGA